MDQRRRQWFPLAATWAVGHTGTRIREQFGHVGLAVWAGYLAACKANRVQGEIEYWTEEQGWCVTTGAPPDDPPFTLAEFFAFTGRLHQTRTLRTGMVIIVQATQWEAWNSEANRAIERDRKAQRRARDEHATSFRRASDELPTSKKRAFDENYTSDHRGCNEEENPRKSPQNTRDIAPPIHGQSPAPRARADLDSDSESEKDLRPSSSSTTQPGKPAAAVTEIFEHWRTVRAHPRAKLTDGRRRKITARLKRFDAATLCRAIDAVALDVWDERAKFDDLVIVFRSDEQVEKFLELADRANGAYANGVGAERAARERERRHLDAVAAREGRL